MLTTGVWVQTPADGPGEIVQVRHSGGLVVMLRDGRARQYRGSALTIQADEPEPAPIDPPPAAAAITGTWTDTHGAMLAAITADRTSDCPPLSRDTDQLAGIRRHILARPFPAWALVPQPR
jgi:hypothetical protein